MFEARSRLSSSDVLIDASAAEEADEEDDEKGPAATPVALAVAQAGDVETAVLTGLDTRTHRLATVPEAAVAATLPPAGERRPSLLPAFVFGAAPPAPRNYLSERRESEAIVSCAHVCVCVCVCFSTMQCIYDSPILYYVCCIAFHSNSHTHTK